MSASVYPPAGLSIFDPGGVREYWIDGLAYYREEGGIVQSGYYLLEPVMPILGEPAVATEHLARLEVRLRCTVECQRRMRQVVLAATEKVVPIMGINLLAS